MIQTGSTEKRSVCFRVLSDDQIEEIKRTAFEVMSKVGFRVHHEGARKMLNQAGALVNGEIVKVPKYVVRECLRTTPKGWTVYDREGNRAMEVEGRKSYYGTSTAGPNTKDALSGEIHPTRVADIAIGAKVADALMNIDWVMPMGSVQDVPSPVTDLFEFEAVVTHTTKPVVFLGYTPRGVELVFKMAAEVAGGIEKLRERPSVNCESGNEPRPCGASRGRAILPTTHMGAGRSNRRKVLNAQAGSESAFSILTRGTFS